MTDVRDLTLLGRQARLWLGALPAMSYPVVQVLEHECLAQSTTSTEVRWAAIEWHRASCGPSSYGLLGAEWTPHGAERLVVRVLVSADVPFPGRGWRPQFSPDPRPGLPLEYAEPVLKGALEAEALPALGTGVLCFCQAAHDVVGSSPLVFQWLTHAVVCGLTLGDTLPTDEALMRLLHLQASPSLSAAH
jgi:hypothetical protein